MAVVTRDSPVTALLLLGLLACDRESADRTREVVERSAEQARERFDEVRDEVTETGREGLRQAKVGLDRWLADRRETADAQYRPIPGAAAAIACDSATHCTIDPAFIDRLASDPSVLANEAIAVPREGNTDTGLALDRVREGSIPALLGLRDGDLLISLNGTNLASLDAPAALADALSGTNVARLVYVRGATRQTLTIERTTERTTERTIERKPAE